MEPDAAPPRQSVVKSWGSTSGLLAVAVADTRQTHALLCGVPMEPQSHFFDTEPWLNADNAWRGWAANEARMIGWVRSMSGRTAEMLGHPTAVWLHGRGGR